MPDDAPGALRPEHATRIMLRPVAGRLPLGFFLPLGCFASGGGPARLTAPEPGVRRPL